MHNLRKVVALSATGALALLGLAVTGADAQTVSTSNIGVALRTAGPLPTGVSGYRVDITCSNLQPAGGAQNLTATFGTTGGAVVLPFGLNPTSVGGGSSCIVYATPTGTANLTAATPTITIGGTARAVSTLVTPIVAGSTTYRSAEVAVTAATDVVVTFTYPSITVKKVVAGDELTAGFDYPMVISCQYADGVNIPNVRAQSGAATGFDGNFTLKKDATRTFGVSEFPQLVVGARCQVTETNAGGGSTSFASSQSPNADGTARPALPGVIVGGVFQSASTEANGQTITVTNAFTGDLIVSKVVTGDPKTNIAVYEISVACDKGGPKDSFLLKDRQSKVYTGLATGMNCLITETRTDGAEASYSDNSGDNTTDGRVTIKGTASGCLDKNLSAFPDCRANVIITNSYNVTTTTTTAAATTTVAPATTAAPAVIAEPATPVVEEPTFTG